MNIIIILFEFKIFLTEINIIDSGPIVTYNITVDINSNYFADGVLVHNKGDFDNDGTAGTDKDEFLGSSGKIIIEKIFK